MQHYTDEYGNIIYCFWFCGGQYINVTLEDVMYLTGLRIKGKPVIPENSKDLTFFTRIFRLREHTHKLRLVQLKTICIDQEMPTDPKIKAVFLRFIWTWMFHIIRSVCRKIGRCGLTCLGCGVVVIPISRFETVQGGALFIFYFLFAFTYPVTAWVPSC